MTRRQADGLLVAATFLWGTSFVVVKSALASTTPLALVAIRFAIATVLLTPFTRLAPLPTRREASSGLLLGMLLAAGFATQTVGLVHTTPSRSAFIVASSSVLAPVVAFFAVRERPRWWTVAAFLLAGVGIYYLTAPEAGGFNRGDLWTLGTAVVWGGQIVAVAELARRHDPTRLVWMQTAFTAVGAALGAALFEDARIGWTPAFTGALGFLAVFATAVALRWQMRAQRHMSSARAALIFCLEPVFAAGTSWLWLGERLSLTQWLGGGLILLGMVVADLPSSRQPVEVGPPRDDIPMPS